MYNNIILEEESGLAVLIINRPQAMNALNYDTLQEIGEVLHKIKVKPNIQALIVTGAGEKAFVAGADIAYMESLNAIQGREFGALGQAVFTAVENLPIPVIAAVNGFALGGGCELAMACDIRLACDKARFGQPEVSLGITPGFGGTQRLPRLIGSGPAKELIFTGMNIDANEALRLGLVNRIYPADILMDEARNLAHKIIANAPLAVRLCKAAINRGLQADIDTALSIEADVFGLCFSTRDQKEGMNAFINKRKADFAGQ